MNFAGFFAVCDEVIKDDSFCLETGESMNDRKYSEEEYLQIAEIQHFAFCPRQWALDYLEGQWQENVLTIEGHALHDKAHDPMSREKRKGKIIVRGMRVFSASLGISGDCDIVEFHQKKDGVFIPSFEGTYEVVPIEYKRGRPKEGEEDVFQLALQALCLEDMFCTTIPYGYIYYGETRRREKTVFSEEQRDTITKLLEQMRQYIARGYTPKVRRRKGCRKCSLADICLPKLKQDTSVQDYLEKKLIE